MRVMKVSKRKERVIELLLHGVKRGQKLNGKLILGLVRYMPIPASPMVMSQLCIYTRNSNGRNTSENMTTDSLFSNSILLLGM